MNKQLFLMNAKCPNHANIDSNERFINKSIYKYAFIKKA